MQKMCLVVSSILCWNININAQNLKVIDPSIIQKSALRIDVGKTTPFLVEYSNVYFSPLDDISAHIVKIIDKSQESLTIAIFGLTDTNIAYAIIAAKQRGVDVKVYRDKLQSSEKKQKELNKLLVDNSVPLKVKKSGILMHMKMMIVDNKHVVTGSYNWSDGAKKQDNDLIICLDPCPLVILYNKKFNEMWGSN